MTFDLSPWHFLLVMGRTASLIAFFPMLSELRIPKAVRAGIALWTSLVITPLVPVSAFQPATIPDLTIALVLETFIGTLFAFVIRLIIAGIVTGVQWIDSEIGFQAAMQMNPLSGTPSSPFGTMALSIIALIFWSSGFFENLLVLWTRIFQILPPPITSISLETGTVLLTLSCHIFAGAIEIAAPIVALMFLLSLAMGLLARAVQGINIFFETFTLKILLGIPSIIILTPYLVNVMQQHLNLVPTHWQQLLHAIKAS
ncbi:MAG: flagellar biosynthetic protein FliR [Verrucomicrobiae bacterium]|nr:flagellar biosynthetic protein FliR [Verrucomicrobiae bacterium]